MFRLFWLAAVGTLVIVGVQLAIWVVGCNNWNTFGFFNKASTLQVRICLITGADVSERDNRGRTPLHNSAGSNSWDDRQTNIVELLIAAGADITAMDVEGRIPLHLAMGTGYPLKPAVVEALTFLGVDFEIRDEMGFTPLQRYASYAGPEVIKALISAGANIDAKVDKESNIFEFGPTLLHVAATNPHPRGGEVIELLISAGLDVNVRDDQGLTPLHIAAAHLPFAPSAGVLVALISAGADMTARDQEGELPIDKADRSLRVNLTSRFEMDSSRGAAYQILGAARLE